jgi:diaminopimelate epimerase
VKFSKYHALGNDYLVCDYADWPQGFAVDEIVRICDRHFGIGSDGILWGPLATPEADFGLRIYNPDGSEAQKSGNGLRIFCRYLFDRGRVAQAPFRVWTLGGVVRAQVLDGGRSVTVEMGRASFASATIPVAGAPRDVIDETMAIDGETLRFSAATIGNPHCVVLRQRALAEDAKRFGPLIERDARFPERTNVQFLEVIDRAHIRIEIWERGAGYTLASGSSSSAAAAVAHRLGLVDREVAVQMPGGTLQIAIGENYAITMTGPVSKVADGVLAADLFADAGRR